MTRIADHRSAPPASSGSRGAAFLSASRPRRSLFTTLTPPPPSEGGDGHATPATSPSRCGNVMRSYVKGKKFHACCCCCCCFSCCSKRPLLLFWQRRRRRSLGVFSGGRGGGGERGVGVRCFSAGLKGQANIDSPLPPLLCSDTIKHIFVLAPHQ